MIKHFKRVNHRFGIKRLMWIIIVSGIVLMPEDLIHLIAVVAHTLYEGIAFAIEELLVHSFGFSKFQAQMIVFYTSFVVGVLGAIGLIRRIPRMAAQAKTLATQRYIQIRADLINTWQVLSTRRKFELTLIQFAGIVSMMALALA